MWFGVGKARELEHCVRGMVEDEVHGLGKVVGPVGQRTYLCFSFMGKWTIFFWKHLLLLVWVTLTLACFPFCLPSHSISIFFADPSFYMGPPNVGVDPNSFLRTILHLLLSSSSFTSSLSPFLPFPLPLPLSDFIQYCGFKYHQETHQDGTSWTSFSLRHMYLTFYSTVPFWWQKIASWNYVKGALLISPHSKCVLSEVFSILLTLPFSCPSQEPGCQS